MDTTIQLDNVNARFTRFEGCEVTEFHAILQVESPLLSYQQQLEALLNAFSRLRREYLQGARPVFKRYFLSDAANQTDLLMNYELETTDCALSVVQQAPLNGTKIALWAYLMTNIETRALPSGLYEARHGEFRHLWLGSASNHAKDSERQTRILLNDYVMQLMNEGCSLADNCIRTWFFVNDVDLNYQGVVKARNEVFITQNLTDKTHFIASTGIGGRGADASILSQMDAYAIDGVKREQIHYLYAATHLNRTSDYGVSFERGTYIDYGDRRHVFISGTASINNKGEIMHRGNVVAQCQRMWENVETLLAEAGCTYSDVMQMVVYLRDPADYQTVRSMYEERFPDKPWLIVNAKVCRPGWLIEQEVMAVKAQSTDFPCL
jgi:enamine deaminase RidA (YjgF/YER057c/UK114 family)